MYYMLLTKQTLLWYALSSLPLLPSPASLPPLFLSLLPLICLPPLHFSFLSFVLYPSQTPLSPLFSLQRFFIPELVALLVILSPRLLLSLLSLPLFVTDLSSSIKLLILIQQIWNFSADITSACMVRTKTKEGGRRCKIFVATSNCRIWCLYYPPPWLSSSPSSDDTLSSQQLSKLEPDSKYVSFSPLLSWFFCCIPQLLEESLFPYFIPPLFFILWISTFFSFLFFLTSFISLCPFFFFAGGKY